LHRLLPMKNTNPSYGKNPAKSAIIEIESKLLAYLSG